LICIYIALLDLGILRKTVVFMLVIAGCFSLNFGSFQVMEPLQMSRMKILVGNMLLYVNHAACLESPDVAMDDSDTNGEIAILEAAKIGKVYDASDGVKDEELRNYISMHQALVIPQSTKGGGLFSVNSVILGKHLLKVVGWSFMTVLDGAKTEKYVVLRSKDETYVFNTFPINRPDVSKHYHGDLDHSGFYALIIKKDIKSDEYDLWYYLKGTGSEVFQDTHTKLEVKE
jgi:hypothetical protein